MIIITTIDFRHHLALPTEAETHYRAVCRALVSDHYDEDDDDDDDDDDDNEDDDAPSLLTMMIRMMLEIMIIITIITIIIYDYKQVSEALELSSFMEKISSSRLNETIDGEVRPSFMSSSSSSPLSKPYYRHHHHNYLLQASELGELGIQDWARLWVQVV